LIVVFPILPSFLSFLRPFLIVSLSSHSTLPSFLHIPSFFPSPFEFVSSLFFDAIHRDRTNIVRHKLKTRSNPPWHITNM
jgi:hypothetical protein